MNHSGTSNSAADGSWNKGLTVLQVCSVFETSGSTQGSKAKYSPTGGVQIHTGALVRQLDRRGISQVVLTSYKPDAPRKCLHGEHALVRRFGVPVRRWRQLWALPAACTAVAAGRRVDLVHAHPSADLAALPIAVSAARAHRVPLVVTLHSSAQHTMRGVGGRLALLKALGAPMEAVALKLADAVITLTDRTRDLVVKSGVAASRVHTIPQPYNQELFTGAFEDPFPQVPRPRILYVGRFSPEKGVPVLLEAFSLMERRAHLVLVGDGRARPQIEAMIRRLNLSDRVSTPGFVPHATVAAALTHGDVLALPSLFEEAGTVLVEAMALGVPVVASDTGGVRQVTRDGEAGLLVPPHSPGALAASLDRVLGDASLARQLAKAGQAHAGEQGWDAAGERVLDIYHQALHHRRG